MIKVVHSKFVEEYPYSPDKSGHILNKDFVERGYTPICFRCGEGRWDGTPLETSCPGTPFEQCEKCDSIDEIEYYFTYHKNDDGIVCNECKELNSTIIYSSSDNMRCTKCDKYIGIDDTDTMEITCGKFNYEFMQCDSDQKD